MNKVRILQNARAILDLPYFVAPKLQFLATVLTYTLNGGHMSPRMVFVALAMYNAPMEAAVSFLPFAVAFLKEADVTVARVEVSRFSC